MVTSHHGHQTCNTRHLTPDLPQVGAGHRRGEYSRPQRAAGGLGHRPGGHRARGGHQVPTPPPAPTPAPSLHLPLHLHLHPHPRLGTHETTFASGAPLVRFPPDGLLVAAALRDQGGEVLGEAGGAEVARPVLGLYQVPCTYPPYKLHTSPGTLPALSPHLTSALTLAPRRELEGRAGGGLWCMGTVTA